MAVFSLDGVSPEIAEGVWIAENAVVIGRVRLRPGVSIWFSAVLRGDNEWIEVGEGSNVQDGAVLHTDPGLPLTIGRNCTVGHQAILHGCTIGDETLIGMGAAVLNGARIGSSCLVGARALVTEHKIFEDGQLIVGAPAKAVRTLDLETRRGLGLSAERYRANAARFAAGLKRIG